MKKVFSILLWWVFMSTFLFISGCWSLAQNRMTSYDCENIYSQDFQYRFWAEITNHEVKYSDAVNSCVAYVELQQYTKAFNNYLLEYEIYKYKKWDMDRIFSKYISITDLNSSINERNNLIKQVQDYYNDL